MVNKCGSDNACALGDNRTIPIQEKIKNTNIGREYRLADAPVYF